MRSQTMTAPRPDRQCSIRRSRRSSWNGPATTNVLSADAGGLGEVRAPPALGCAGRLSRDAGIERRPPRPRRRSRQSRRDPLHRVRPGVEAAEHRAPAADRRADRSVVHARLPQRDPVRPRPGLSPGVTDAIAPLRGDARVTSIRTYYDAPTPSLLSRDG